MTTATAIKIVLTSDYGTLSRGRHSARIGNGSAAIWADKNASGSLIVTRPGTWQLHCTDGFSRVAKAVLTVKANGAWEMSGDCKRFDVIAD